MADQSWAKHVADVLRRSGIRLFATVPDYIVSHVLDELWADPECRVITTAREEEAVGLLSGAWLAGHRGALLSAVTHILDALAIRWIRPTSIAELEQQADGLVKLCYVSAQPVAIVLPSELTGGKKG